MDRAVIFDLDGCLVDSEILSLESLADEMRAAGMENASAEDLRQHFLGVSLATICQYVADSTGRPCPDDFAQRFEERLFQRYESELTVIDGVPDLLEGLAGQGIALAIATGGSVRRMNLTLRKAGIDHYFADRAFSADQVTHGKPAPDLFLLAARQIGVAPSNCLVVEDSPHGIKGAVAAGMRGIGFTGGGHLHGIRDQHAARLRAAGAGCVLPDMAGMLAVLTGPDMPGLQQRITL